MSEWDLLESYLNALQNDPDAPVPPGLDRELAALARQLALMEDAPAEKVRQRVWYRAVTAVQSGQPQHTAPGMNGRAMNGRTPSDPPFTPNRYPLEEKTMSVYAPPTRRMHAPLPLNALALTLAAAALLLLIGGLLSRWSPSPESAVETLLPASDSPRDTASDAARGGEIGIGDTVGAQLTADAPTQSYTFQAEAGQAVEIQLTADAPVSLAETLVVEASEGQGGGGGGGGGSAPASTEIARVMEFPLASTVTLTISAETQPITTPINFTLSIVEIPASPFIAQPTATPQTLQLGETVTGTINSPEEAALYSLVVAAGAGVQVDFEADSPVYIGSGASSLPTIGVSGGGGGGGGGGSPVREFRQSQFFLLNSVYSLDIRPPEDATFPITYSLTVSGLEMPTLAYNTPTEFNGSTYQTHYRFEGQRGDIISLMVEGNPQVDLSMEVYEANSFTRVFTDDDSGHGYLPEITRVQLGVSGSYYVVITDVGGGINTDFTITLTREVSAQFFPELQAQQTEYLPLSDPYPYAIATFSGEAGQRLRLTGERSYGEGITLITVLQAGEQIGLLALNTESSLSTELTIPADGEVVISVNGGFHPELAPHVTVQLTLERIE